jgi:hypothetical protein
MRAVRVAAVAMAGALALGCSGLSRQLSEATGLEVQFGASARVPDDFPLRPPAGAAPFSVMEHEKGTIAMFFFEGAPEPLMDGYAQQMEAAGLTVERSQQFLTYKATGTRPGERWEVEMKPNNKRWQLMMQVGKTPSSP